MGIRGLQRFVNYKFAAHIPEQQIESEAMTLHVDGDSFIFHVMNQQNIYKLMFSKMTVSPQRVAPTDSKSLATESIVL